MSKINRDEILIKYAEQIKTAGFMDVVQELGLGAILNTLSPAMALPNLTALLYRLTDLGTRTKGSLIELKERLRALDSDDPNVKRTLGPWDSQIGEFINDNRLLATPSMSAKPDTKELITLVVNRVQAYKEIVAYLEEMIRVWYAQKYRFTDIGGDLGDIGEAEKSINEALIAHKKLLSDTLQMLSNSSQKIMSDVQKTKGIDVTKISEEIISLFDQITSIYGQKPTLDTAIEKSTYALAEGVMDGKSDPIEVQKYHPYLISFRDALLKGLEIAKTKKKTSARFISKRALTLPDGTKVKSVGIEERPATYKRQGKLPPEHVGALQESINYLSRVFKLGIEGLTVDNTYGPKTAAALIAIMAAKPDIEENIRFSSGFGANEFKDVKLVNDSPEEFKSATIVLVKFVKAIKSKYSGQTEEGSGKYEESKAYPTNETIIAYLKNRSVKVYGEESKAYEYLKSRGLDDGKIISVIKKLFGEVAPIDWSMPVLVNYVEKQKRYGF